MRKIGTVLATAGAITLLSATFGASHAEQPADGMPKLPPGTPAGYLPLAELPDSLALLPPPPDPSSAAFARDEETSKAMARPPDSPRYQRAVSDANLHFAHLSQVFACATGVAPSETATPVLYRLLHRSLVDVGLSTYKAKNHYNRTRPFVLHNNASCTPGDEAMLRKDGSYPSGHSALGWGWGLLLAEIDPDRADAILQRARDFGESRLVCNVHWRSDVDAGRLMASATVARLHADPAFRADLEAARYEIAEARKANAPAGQDCAAEAASLK
jgi:acid phosphatase (class A)